MVEVMIMVPASSKGGVGKTRHFLDSNDNISKMVGDTAKGGATVLKVGGTISRAERAKKFF